MTYYTWRTTKTSKGYEYKVLKVVPLLTPVKGYYAKTTTVESGIVPTRARAKYKAQGWVRYYNNRLRRLKK
jgi:hypothetical protein